MPSPVSDCLRCTRKNPTAGASTPTTAPAPSASRMNSVSNMDVRRVVPDARELGRCAVEDDRSPDEDDPLDEAFDGPELVGDVDDGHAEIRVQLIEQRGQGLLRLRIDACGRLVQNEERRAARKCLRDEGTLLHAAGERPDGNIRSSRQTDALDRLGDELAITPAHRLEQAARQPTGGDDLAYRRWGVTAELGALREIPEGAPS